MLKKKKKDPDLNQKKKKKNGNDFRSEILKTMSKPGIFERKDQPLQVMEALLQ